LVVAALDVVHEADLRLEVARSHYATLQAESVHGNLTERREARIRLAKAREAVEDVAVEVDAATTALRQAESAAFSRHAPVIKARHQQLLPSVETALRQALETAEALKGVETLASTFVLHATASIAPGRSPVAGRVGEFIAAEIGRCLDAINRVRQQPRPAA
jgi:hypothetical protein